MKRNLHDAAKEYIAVIEKIEKTTDPRKLQILEEKKGGTSLGIYRPP